MAPSDIWLLGSRPPGKEYLPWLVNGRNSGDISTDCMGKYRICSGVRALSLAPLQLTISWEALYGWGASSASATFSAFRTTPRPLAGR